MLPERFPPDDPREWLNRARSNLIQAEGIQSGVYLEDLCFQAQQAAEKALKALLLYQGREIPRVHDLAELIRHLEQAGEPVPPQVRESVQLTPYATITRYPGVSEPVSQSEYEEALRFGREVVLWVGSIIFGETVDRGEVPQQ